MQRVRKRGKISNILAWASTLLVFTGMAGSKARRREMSNSTFPRLFCVYTLFINYLSNQSMTDTHTLSNVNPIGEGQSPGVGITSNTIPKAKSSQIGVSVKYAYNPSKKWFVLRATYGRELKAYHYLLQDNVDAYVPVRHIMEKTKGKPKNIQKPLLPGILFVYCEEKTVVRYLKNTPALSFLRYYYNHLVTKPDGSNPPLIVDYHEMMNFIEATNVDNEHIRVVEASHCHYKSGDIVRIIDGAFKGVEGKVARVAGQQRVIVEVSGLCMIATAYIPSAFIVKHTA